MADPCPIPSCPLPATSLGLCPGHFRLVPVPIKSEIYQLVKRHKGGPSHQQAVRRAAKAVQVTLDLWTEARTQQRLGL